MHLLMENGLMRRFASLFLPLVLLAACSFSTSPLATDRPTFVPTQVALNPTDVRSTAFIMPTLPPSPTPICPGAPRTRLIVNERGWVLDDDPRPINLRVAPGLDNRSLQQIGIGEVFYVLEGPVCQDNFAWYKIRYQGSEGWIAEGDFSSYYVEPYLVG